MRPSVLCLIFLLTRFHRSSCLVSDVQRGSFYRVIPETNLDGHVMSRYSTYSEIECAMKCESTTGCASVNFKSSGLSADQRSDKGICELNSVSIRESSSSGVYQRDVAYLDKDT